MLNIEPLVAEHRFATAENDLSEVELLTTLMKLYWVKLVPTLLSKKKGKS